MWSLKWEVGSGRGNCKVSGVKWKLESIKGCYEVQSSTLFTLNRLWYVNDKFLTIKKKQNFLKGIYKKSKEKLK